MKDVCWRLPLFLLLAAAMVMVPLTQTAQAVPAKGGDCYTPQCHTLGASAAAPTGKGVQNELWLAVTDPPVLEGGGGNGIFERHSNTAAPHTLGNAEWETEGRCVGCHTDKQVPFDEVGVPTSRHPVYNVVNSNHVRCIDCHDAAILASNYHVAVVGDHLKGTFDCNECHNGNPELTYTNIVNQPIQVHGTVRYNTASWDSCYGATGCHSGHAETVNDGLVKLVNYNTAASTPYICETCHTDQDVSAATNNDYRHNLDNTTSYAECDVCHDYSTHTGGTIFMVNFSGGNMDAATTLDAFCEQCHGGTYPSGFTGWQGGTVTGGGAGNVDIDGDASTYGYEFTGHGLDSGDFAAAAWKAFDTGTGNPSPPEASPTGSWDGGVNPFTAAVSCNACHDAHWTTQPYIIDATIQVTSVTDGVTACTACHNDILGIDATSQFAGLNAAAYNGSAHATGGTLSCYGDTDGDHATSGCHDPHGTLGAFKSMMPGDEEDGCTALSVCHGATSPIGYNKDTSTGELSLNSHHPVTANGTADYNGDATNDEVECTNCHNPHIATAAYPMVNPDNITVAMTDQATTPDFSLETDFCLACHDGLAAPVNYGVQGALEEENHWGPGGGTPPSEEAFSNVQCDHCHDPHGSQNLMLVGPTLNGPTATDPMSALNRYIYNVNSTQPNKYMGPVIFLDRLEISEDADIADFDPTDNDNGNNDGDNPLTGDGVCDRCHYSGDNFTHTDAFGTRCTRCHDHNGNATILAAFPMLSPAACFQCHSSTASSNFRTQGQYLVAHGGNMASGTDHDITYNPGTQVDCLKCHVLDDATYPHKNGTVVSLKAADMGATLYTNSGDYKIQGGALSVTLAAEVGFCLECHANPPADALAGNFTGYTDATTPTVAQTTDLTGTNYQLFGHGAGFLLGNGTAAPAVGCTACHQYHGGSIAQTGGFPQTLVAVNNEDMIERLTLTGPVDYDYIIDSAADKDAYCAETCHSASLTIDAQNYTNGQTVLDHTWGEPGDASGNKSQCPWNAGDDIDGCETHPTNVAIPVSVNYDSNPTLPLAAFDFGNTLGGAGNTGNIICTSCHDPHGKDDPGGADRQMVREAWGVGGTLCGQCHITP